MRQSGAVWKTQPDLLIGLWTDRPICVTVLCMPDPASQVSEEEAGREAFAALLRERIPDYPARGSLEAFAMRCGGRITGPQIGQYARGELTPRLDTLKLLCKGMGVPLMYGFSVLAGLESAEKVPPPDDLHVLALRINEAADVINRLMVRSTNAAHQPRRRSRRQSDLESPPPDDGITQSIDMNIDCKMDYEYKEVNDNHNHVNRGRKRELTAA
jgi:transcriptional regulator with XRE-family HTH domain